MPKQATKVSQPTRGDQPYTGGLGRVFTSPVKPRDARKEKQKFKPLGYEARRKDLLATLQRIGSTSGSSSSLQEPDASSEIEGTPIIVDIENDNDEGAVSATADEIQPNEKPKKPKRSTANNQDRLYENWSKAIESLIAPLLAYISRTMSQKLEHPADLKAQCSKSELCPHKTHKVLCLFHDCFEERSVEVCDCEDSCHVLVRNGLFPCSPSQPRMAIAISLLDFYQALFERSCDAVNAFAAACHTYYNRRGFVLRNSKGEAVQDAFRRAISRAIQWYDNLQVEISKTVDAALKLADELITASELPTPPTTTGRPPDSSVPSGNNLTECERVLQQCCPACFGGSRFGLPFEEGGDIHVSVDGNFNHRHLRKAGDCPEFYEAKYYLSKDYVDEVGEHIDIARKGKKKPRKPKVPDQAVDECQEGHIAGTESKVKTNMDKYDDTGTMALVCRHDIPIFLANIDTPGEQQKYAVALIKKLFSLLPPCANVAVFYDVGCVLDRSLEIYDILPADITNRITFATSAMHAYAHQWACQLVYNPRLRKSLGLTDGEGTERVWSRLRKIIGISRVSAKSRRIWLIDRLTGAIGTEMRDNLGDWIRRRLKTIDKYHQDAQKALAECKNPISELRLQWQEQREAQMSIRAHLNPKFVKKELDMILLLQADLDRIDDRIESTTASLTKVDSSSEAGSLPAENTAALLRSLHGIHDALKEKVEGLYLSLNVEESYPELKGLDYNFVRVLLLLRDLKINIRKRAIASFFEWDKLDRASGGREITLGTTVHQLTRKAITNRKRSLMAAISKYNGLCLELTQLHKPEWKIPLPKPLPQDITSLRDTSDLMEDVWITRSDAAIPKWLESVQVRDGIRAMLKLDRCQEEYVWLGREADNLCRWYGRELASVEVAISQTPNQKITLQLDGYRNHLLLLKSRWVTPLASDIRFDSQVSRAKDIVSKHQSERQLDKLTWITPRVSQLDISDANDIRAPTEVANAPDSNDLLLADYLCDEAPADEKEGQRNTAALMWELPDPLSYDHCLLDALQFQTVAPVPRHHSFRRFVARPGTREGVVEFCPRSINILSCATERLNDVCINSGGALLQYILSDPSSNSADVARNCALFSTFDLLSSRYNISNHDVWNHTKHLRYWSKALWILPIHRKEPVAHWVLCAIYPHHRYMLLFDSLGEREPWHKELEEIMTLINRLVLIANTHGNPLPIVTDEGWSASPVNVRVIQTSPVTCGLWVLAETAALLRGYHVTAVTEQELQMFRATLYEYVLLQPCRA